MIGWKSYTLSWLAYFSTAGGLKGDRNGFTKMSVTALIITAITLIFFNTESQIHKDSVLKKSE